MTRRHPAGTSRGGQFAPTRAPEPPPAVSVAASLAARASVMDDLAARASAAISPWEASNATFDGVVAAYQSYGCSTAVGPLSEKGPVTLSTHRVADGRWTAVAYLLQPSRHLGNGLLRCVFVEPPDEERGCWPDQHTAMAALETVLCDGPGVLAVRKDQEEHGTWVVTVDPAPDAQ